MFLFFFTYLYIYKLLCVCLSIVRLSVLFGPGCQYTHEARWTSFIVRGSDGSCSVLGSLCVCVCAIGNPFQHKVSWGTRAAICK